MAQITVSWHQPDTGFGLEQLHPQITLPSGVRRGIYAVDSDWEMPASEQVHFTEPVPLRSGLQWFGAVGAEREIAIPMLFRGPTKEAILDEITALNRTFQPGLGQGFLQTFRKLADQTTDLRLETTAQLIRKIGFSWHKDATEGLVGYGKAAIATLELMSPSGIFRTYREDEHFHVWTYAGVPLTETIVNFGDVPVGAKFVFSSAAGSQVLVVNLTTGRGFTLNQDLATGPITVDFYNDDIRYFRAYRGVENMAHALDINAWMELVPGNNTIQMAGDDDFGAVMSWRSGYSNI